VDNRRKTTEEQPDSLKTLDEIDFQFKRQLHGGCAQCSRLSGGDHHNYAKNDPGMFDYVVRYRATIKNQKKRAPEQGRHHIVDDEGADRALCQLERQLTFEEKEARRKANFPQWKEQMEIQCARSMREKLIASRPKYIKLYDAASELHLGGYWRDLDLKSLMEQEAKESLDR